MAKIDLTSQEWCQLIFEGKNQAYGAYKMRANSTKRHNLAMLAVLVIALIGFTIPTLVKLATPKQKEVMTQTARCLHLINCCIGRFYGRCPNPQFLKKLSKLFCSFADNLALAKFQRPTDTPLNHNLLMLSQHLKYTPKSILTYKSVYPLLRLAKT